MTKKYAELKIREEYRKILEQNIQFIERIQEDEHAKRGVITLLKENVKVFYNSANVVISIFIDLSEPESSGEWRDLFKIVCDLTTELEKIVSEMEE